jgi:EAL domain-containing protein (putative c-di-GMP-specific phosphodiesterase class I)/GGDEF domain-containing protein
MQKHDNTLKKFKQRTTLMPVTIDGALSAPLAEFVNIINTRHLHAVFQPILDMHSGKFFAFEALIRGPQHSDFYSPQALFDCARQLNMSDEFEHICREVIFADYAQLKLPGKLFINASIPCLNDIQFRRGDELPVMQALGIAPRNVVIEITENHLVSDFSALHDVLADYRNLGFDLAMDDLGEGFSNLRMWSEVRPEFVKIDRHFITGIADDPLKFQLVRAMHQIAETCGSQLIAEGIETEAEFTTLRDLGIRFTQGYLIAKPHAQPAVTASEHIQQLRTSARIIVFPQQDSSNSSHTPISQLLRVMAPIDPDTENDAVYTRFENEPKLQSLPVVDNGQPIGMIYRHAFSDHFARPYRRELFGKKPCRTLMNQAILIVDHADSLQQVACKISGSEQETLQDYFIITREGRYLGIGSSRELMNMITNMQIKAARYANPLTQLPGNVPINEHIDRLLASNTPFVACYADLDAFKPYNDTYGFRRGDDVILMLAQVLGEVIDPRLDFLGHIGGDDFMVLFQSSDWESRCQNALALFDQRLVHLVAPEHLAMRGFTAENRQGEQVFTPITALSLGCIVASPQLYHSHHEVAGSLTDAKKQAKKTLGSSLFVERRTLDRPPQSASNVLRMVHDEGRITSLHHDA